MRKRILIAKPGLDGHDRGAKVVARLLRDGGYEVIYTGIRQRPDEIAAAAVAEDVSLVGLSILSGAHLGLTQKVMASLAAREAADIPVVVGGTIPTGDVDALRAQGVAAVFPTGTRSDNLLEGIRRILVGEEPLVGRPADPQ
jgi:methylmalonyl-CoA mutase C-terminal domain/subunit